MHLRGVPVEALYRTVQLGTEFPFPAIDTVGG